MPVAPAITAGAGLFGAIESGKQQQQSSNAASQAFGGEENAIKQLLNNYFAMAPTVEKGLENFPSVQARENQSIVNQFGASNMSLINTLRGGLGGIANPGSVLQSMTGQGLQEKAALGQQLGSQTGAQDLQANEALGQFISGPLSAGLGGLGNIGSIYAGAAGQGQNPWPGAIGGLSGLFPSGTGTGTGGLGNLAAYTPSFNTLPLTGSSYSYNQTPQGPEMGSGF